MRRGRVIAGKYRLESPLARGGMGSVWTARHVLLDVPVAVKFIVASTGGAGRTRFEREAKAAAMLQSPHVVRIYDYGLDAETPYLVMELLEGEDLAERLAARRRLTVGETVALVVQVARALRRASEEAIVHRDLKPSNIFMVRGDDDDGGEIVKVLDFGVAKAPRISVVGDATKTGTIVGSPRYMSPEQARASGAVDHRSDLWSLAVIAYRALTGRVPFPGDDLAAVVLSICTECPPPPSQIVPELGAGFDEFFARALERDPAQRFQTARALATAFAAAAGEDQPPASMSPSSLRAVASAWHASPSPERASPPSPPALALEVTRASGPHATPPPAESRHASRRGDPVARRCPSCCGREPTRRRRRRRPAASTSRCARSAGRGTCGSGRASRAPPPSPRWWSAGRFISGLLGDARATATARERRAPVAGRPAASPPPPAPRPRPWWPARP